MAVELVELARQSCARDALDVGPRGRALGVRGCPYDARSLDDHNHLVVHFSLALHAVE